MADAKGSPGTSKLARVMSNRIREFCEQSEEDNSPDFGVINNDMSLTTNRFPISIPQGEYYLGRLVSGLKISVSGGSHGGHENGDGSHSHTITLPGLSPGDHVLVVWVQDDPVVVDVLRR